MSRYATHVSTRVTPQSQPVPGRQQVANHAGGYVFAVDCWTQLDRFLILGNEGGSYYAGEREMTVSNSAAVSACVRENPQRAVERIVEVSEAGRAPKNDPAIFALAQIAGERREVGNLALRALPRVCRTGTHLFQFWEAVRHFRGRGRSLNRAVADWYLSQTPRNLAYQLVKYQQRNGWSHRDILRLVRPTASDEHALAFRWAVGKAEILGPGAMEGRASLLPIMAFEAAKRATSTQEICRLIREYDLVRECVPSQYLTEPAVWEALLDKMPVTALIRNLATMTKIGLLAPMSAASRTVRDRLGDVELLKKGRVHPLSVLLAQRTYASGRGLRGCGSWSPVPQVIDALNDAFYLAFAAVEPTGKRWLLALDVSGSMTHAIGTTGLSCREGAACLSLVTANTERDHAFVAFAAGDRPSMHAGYGTAIKPLSISARQRLDDVVHSISNIPFGGTDCALPMLYAIDNKLAVDVFVIYTDNETWFGDIHPFQALQRYREKMGINAKLIVVGMTATQFSIADPRDSGMLDVVGFDAHVPLVMGEFARS